MALPKKCPTCYRTFYHAFNCPERDGMPFLGPWPGGIVPERDGFLCLACVIEAEIGSEENPHPIPRHFHSCEEK